MSASEKLYPNATARPWSEDAGSQTRLLAKPPKDWKPTAAHPVFIVLQTGLYVSVERDEQRENARLIRHAVNTYDASDAVLREALRWLQDGRSLDEWEDIASWFYADTGFLWPGKDQAMAMGGHPTYEEREAAWQNWCVEKKRAIKAKIESVLSPGGAAAKPGPVR